MDMDIISMLSSSGHASLVLSIFEQLDLNDLKCCQLVSHLWCQLVDGLWDHYELNRVGKGWTEADPNVREVQCFRDRAVCTVSGLALDERSMVFALGGSGNIEVWDRRSLEKLWDAHAHDEGVYSVDLGLQFAVSGGDDTTVKIWERECGDLLQTLRHHEYIVWNVRMWMDCLVSCSYDCSIAYLKVDKASGRCSLQRTVKGPVAWADGLSTDRQGRFLSTHNEETFVIDVWNLSDETVTEVTSPSVSLHGHTDEVNSVRFQPPYIASGGSDKTVRLWELSTGVCLCVLKGMEGKVWSVDLDRWRLVAGGRYGEVLVWSVLKALEEGEEEFVGRSLQLHSRSSSVGQVKIERGLLVSADGMGKVVMADFWNLDRRICGCGKKA